MEQIINYFKSISMTIQITDIIIALCIALFFRFLSGSFSYIIIRILKIRDKQFKKVKESAFYIPLKVFFSILGYYLAIRYLKEPLKISDQIMDFIYRGFLIISTIAFSRGLAQSFTPKATLYKRIKNRVNPNVEDSMFDFMIKMLRGLIYILSIFIVFAIIGINLNGLVTGLGISGLIVTLAAQDTAKNLFGGAVIFIDKPFIVGDWIQMENFEGTVEDITFRSTRIRTFENSLVNIPNSVIANAAIINWSKMEKRRYKTNLCIELDTPLDQLEKFKKKVEKMLQSREAIYDDSIIVKFDNITDNGINVLVSSYTNSVDYISYLTQREEINYKIMKILEDEKIKLAYDTKTIHVENKEIN